jgi:hypothetical protein
MSGSSRRSWHTVRLLLRDWLSWTHDQLEEHLTTHGRELLRLLLQDHLDLRAVREQHAVGQGRAAPVTEAGGLQHRKVEIWLICRDR